MKQRPFVCIALSCSFLFLFLSFRLYNLDVFNYELDSPFSTYGSMPFLMALHAPISRHTSGRHTGGLGRYGGTRRFSSFGSMKEPTGGGGREEANRGASRGVRDEDLLSLHSAVPKRRRGSFSSSLSADAGESTHNRDESDPRAKPALVTGFMILNPTEIWMKLRYDEGGEDLPESYAGLNEEEDEPEDPITRRHKRGTRTQSSSPCGMVENEREEGEFCSPSVFLPLFRLHSHDGSDPWMGPQEEGAFS